MLGMSATISPEHYRKLLVRNQNHSLPIGRLLCEVFDVLPGTRKLFNINLERYKSSPIISQALEGRQLNEQIQIIQNCFPTFFFVFCSQLKSQSEFVTFANDLQICGLVNILNHLDFRPALLSEVAVSLEEEIQIYTRDDRNKATTNSALMINRDLFLIGRSIMWNGKSVPEQLESYYSMKGIADFFMRYYFELLAIASTDSVVKAYEVFENFFTILRFQETLYLKRHARFEASINKIPMLIRNEYTFPQHYLLTKHNFDNVNFVMPILYKLTGGSVSLVKKRLDDQINILLNLSIPKILFFLRAVQLSYPVSCIEQLVTFIGAKYPQKLQQILKYMMASEQLVKFDYLLPVIQIFAKKILQSIQKKGSKQVELEQQAVSKKVELQQQTASKKVELQQHQQKYGAKEPQKIASLKQRIAKQTNQLIEQAHHSGQGLKKLLEDFARVFQEYSEPQPISLKDVEHITQIAQNAISHLEYTSKVDADIYTKAIQESMKNLEQCGFQQRIQALSQISKLLSASTEMDRMRKEAEKEYSTYRNVMEHQVFLTHAKSQQQYEVPLEKINRLPIAHEDRLKLINQFSQGKLPQESLQVVNKVHQRCPRDAVENLDIIQNSHINMKVLGELLFPQKQENQIAQQEVILIPELDRPKIQVAQFFEFPFVSLQNEQNPFKQHLFYLEYLVKQKELAQNDYDHIATVLDSFRRIQFKKYYDIVIDGRFDELTLLAVYGLWKSNGFKNLKK